MTDLALNQFEAFKKLYPDLDYLQAVSPTRRRSLDGGESIDWNTVVPVDFVQNTRRFEFSACDKAIGTVVFDVVALAVGAVGLRASLRPATIDAMAEAVATILDPIKRIIAEIGTLVEAWGDQAYGVYRILKAVYDGGVWKAVWKAFLGNLTWYNAIIYAVSGVATILAAFATGGIALAAEIALLLVAAVTVAVDLKTAIETCDITAVPPPARPQLTADNMPIKASIAIRTQTNNFFTIIDNGGLAAPDFAGVMATDRKKVGDWEKFKLVPLDHVKNTFALMTHSGNYLGATDGGGLRGPNNASSPIHTDATQVRAHEKLVLIKQADGTYAISTTAGYYLTAINGGGRGGANDSTCIIHTDATEARGWETFSFDQLEQTA